MFYNIAEPSRKFCSRKFQLLPTCAPIPYKMGTLSYDLHSLQRHQTIRIIKHYRKFVLLQGHCHLEGHIFKMGLNADPICWEVSRRWWIKYTHLMWLWGGCLHKSPSLGSILYGTKWLLWRLHRQSPTLHSKCGINHGLIKRNNNRSWKVAVQGLNFYGQPLIRIYTHTYIHTYIRIYNYCC
jgi:hypothetical protein